MTKHMQGTLIRLAQGNTVGFHFGTLKALVKRGLAETVRDEVNLRTDYRATVAGAIIAEDLQKATTQTGDAD